jgi:hypothetical protein
MDLPGIIVLSKLQLKTDSRGLIKQGSLSKKGLLRGNGDAALIGDPLVTFLEISGQVRNFLGVT